MSAQKITRIVAIAVVASFAVLTPAPSIGVAWVSASARKGDLHVTKECCGRRGARIGRNLTYPAPPPSVARFDNGDGRPTFPVKATR